RRKRAGTSLARAEDLQPEVPQQRVQRRACGREQLLQQRGGRLARQVGHDDLVKPETLCAKLEEPQYCCHHEQDSWYEETRTPARRITFQCRRCIRRRRGHFLLFP